MLFRSRLNKKLKEVEDNIISLWSAERMLGNDPENNKHLMQMLADYNALKKQIEDTKIQQQWQTLMNKSTTNVTPRLAGETISLANWRQKGCMTRLFARWIIKTDARK